MSMDKPKPIQTKEQHEASLREADMRAAYPPSSDDLPPNLRFSRPGGPPPPPADQPMLSDPKAVAYAGALRADANRCWHCGGPTELFAAAGHSESRRCQVPDCFSNFRGPGIASFLADEQKKCALRADANRLEELREELDALSKAARRQRQVEALVAVHEELAARGLTFGGER